MGGGGVIQTAQGVGTSIIPLRVLKSFTYATPWKQGHSGLHDQVIYATNPFVATRDAAGNVQAYARAKDSQRILLRVHMATMYPPRGAGQGAAPHGWRGGLWRQHHRRQEWPDEQVGSQALPVLIMAAR